MGILERRNFWSGKKVFITGHTGFKGAWLSKCLSLLGADVAGYSLPPEEGSLFESFSLKNHLTHIEGDILNKSKLKKAIDSFGPDVIFHLAAQSLVPLSYVDPVKTYETNVIGSLNLLEVVKECQKEVLCLMITTDKVYENPEDGEAFIEKDSLGANDPYSTSKACMELLIQSHVKSFPKAFEGKVIHVARAGNVIGGGDWADRRLIPDMMRSYSLKKGLTIRNPEAIRPWQHVLDVIKGYLTIVEYMDQNGGFEHWNLSPKKSDVFRVKEIVDLAKVYFPEIIVESVSLQEFHESQYLLLDSSKARRLLAWKPQFSVKESIEQTMNWYQAFFERFEMSGYSENEILNYFEQS